MRDPFSWSLPLFRAFGIQVRLHILFIVVTIGLLGRAYYEDPDHILDWFLIWVVALFGIILLHEFGHCFAARRVEGEADEILIWPLGGLAFCSVPHTARANMITAVGGPLVNVFICMGAGIAVSAAGYLPPVNVFNVGQLHRPELYDWKNGGTVSAVDRPVFVRVDNGRAIPGVGVRLKDGTYVWKLGDDTFEVRPIERSAYPVWVLWVCRIFWLSLLLLVFNLLPAFPMDGGRILQCWLWGRSDDYERSTRTACTTGLVCSLILLVLAFIYNESLLVGVAVFVMFTSYQHLMALQMAGEERGAFGYDFSKGYDGFGDDEPKPRRVRRPGAIRRWLLARRAKKERQEAENRAADEARLDELLDKISKMGKESLTPEERRFMDRVSARYRNRSEPG